MNRKKYINWNDVEYIYLDEIFFGNSESDISDLELSSGTNLLKPSPVIEKSIKDSSYLNYNYYSSPLGSTSIRKEILRFEEVYFNCSFQEDLISSLTSGAADGLRLAFQYLKKIGKQKVLILGLQYAIVFQCIDNAGLELKHLYTKNMSMGYLPSFDEIQRVHEVTDFDIIFMTQPNNPSGTLYSQNELNKILSFAKVKEIFVVYEKIGSDLPFSILENKSINHGILISSGNPNIIIIESFSKKRAISGLRLGYVIGNKDFIKFINFSRFGDCPTLIGQDGILKDMEYTRKIIEHKRGNLNLCNENLKTHMNYLNYLRTVFLENIDNLKVILKDFIIDTTPLDGGFNIMIKLNIKCNELDFAIDLFHRTSIMIYPLGCFTLKNKDKVEENYLQLRVSLADPVDVFRNKILKFKDYLKNYETKQ